MNRRVAVWGTASVAVLASTIVLFKFLVSRSSTTELQPSFIAIDRAGSAQRPLSPTEVAQTAAVEHANRLVETPHPPNAFRAYADCRAAEIVAAGLSEADWRTSGNDRVEALNTLLRRDTGLTNLPLVKLTPCIDRASGLTLDYDPTKSLQIHEGAIRQSLWELLPLAHALVEGRVRSGDLSAIQATLADARRLLDNVEVRWAAYQRLVTEPSLGSIAPAGEIEQLRAQVAALQPSAAIPAIAANNQIDAATIQDISKRLAVPRVKPWAVIDDAVHGLERGYEQLKTRVNAATAKAAEDARSQLSLTTGRYLLGRAADHCIVGDLRRDDGGDLVLTLALLVPLAQGAALPDCSVRPAAAPAQESWRRFDLGFEYVSVRTGRDGALILPGGPRPVLRDLPGSRKALLREVVLPRWAEDIGGQWTVAGDPLAGTLKVSVISTVKVSALDLSVPVVLAFGHEASTVDAQVVSVIDTLRNSIASVGVANLTVTDLPFKISRVVANAGSGWNRSSFAVEAEIDVPKVGTGVVRLELRENRLALATQVLGETWRTLIAQVAPAAIREVAKGMPASVDLSVTVIDSRIEPPGTLTATLRFTRGLDLPTGPLQDLRLRVTSAGIDVAPLSGALQEVLGRLANQVTRAVAATAKDYAKALVTRGFNTLLAGADAIAKASASSSCADGFDLIIRQTIGVQCVIALDAGESPKLDFSRARLVTMPSGTTADPSQVILTALGISGMQVGRLRTSTPIPSAQGLQFSVFLDEVPRLGTVPLGEVVLGVSTAQWPSDLQARFTAVLQKELDSLIAPALRDQLGPVQLTSVHPEFRSDGLFLRTELVATLDVSGTKIPIPVTATWLPAFKLERGSNAQLLQALQGVVGSLGALTGSDIAPVIVTLEPIGVLMTPRVKFSDLFAIALTVYITREGVKVTTPVEIPLFAPITIPPIAIVNPRLRVIGDSLPVKGIGVAGAVTAVSPGVDMIAKIEAVFDLQRDPLRAEFTGNLILVSVIPLASVHALLTPDQFVFDVGTSDVMSSILALRGHGEITRDRLFANGSLGVLGVSMGDGHIEVILCHNCPNEGRVSAAGSVNLLLGQAGATVDFDQFPRNGRLKGTVSFQVDRFHISDAVVVATESGASIDLNVSGTSLTVPAPTLHDLSPARVLEAILALYKMDPEKIVEAMKNPGLSWGAPVGPRSDNHSPGTPGGGGQPGSQGSQGNNAPSPAPSDWATGGNGGGGGSQQPSLRQGSTAISFEATQFRDCVVRRPFGEVIPPGSVEALKKNLTLFSMGWGAEPQVGTPASLTAGGGPASHIFFPQIDGRASGMWAVTLTTDRHHFDAVRMHVTSPCDNAIEDVLNVVRLPIEPEILATNWDWRAARMGQRPHTLEMGDRMLLQRVAIEAISKSDSMTPPLAIDVTDSERVYLWTEKGAKPEDARLAVMARRSGGPALLPTTSILKDLTDPQKRTSWPWLPLIVDGFTRGSNPTFLWPATGSPQLIEIGPVVWFCGASSTCQPVRKVNYGSMSMLSESRGTRFDALVGRLATAIGSAPPAASTPADVKAGLWIGTPAGSSVPVALYSPDLTANSYQVFVIDMTLKGPIAGTTIGAAAKARALECQVPEPKLDSIDAKNAFFSELSLPPPERATCVSPWFFWKSLKTP